MKYTLLFILSLLFTTNCFALGRFFMSPEQRKQLEHPVINNQLMETDSEVIVEKKIYLNGFIKPKSAASTIWVNGKTSKVSPQPNYHVRHWVSPNNQVSVDLEGSRAHLSPGQTLNINSRVIVETPLTIEAIPIAAEKKILQPTPKKQTNIDTEHMINSSVDEKK